jgi:hypothetical protein
MLFGKISWTKIFSHLIFTQRSLDRKERSNRLLRYKNQKAIESLEVIGAAAGASSRRHAQPPSSLLQGASTRHGLAAEVQTAHPTGGLRCERRASSRAGMESGWRRMQAGGPGGGARPCGGGVRAWRRREVVAVAAGDPGVVGGSEGRGRRRGRAWLAAA